MLVPQPLIVSSMSSPASQPFLVWRSIHSNASNLAANARLLAGLLSLPGLLSVLVVFLSVMPLVSPWYWLAPLPSILIVSFLVLLRAPELGIYLVVALSPFGGIRVMVNQAVGVNTYHLLVLAVLLVVAIKIVAGKVDLRKLRCNLWPFFLLFLVVCVISTSLSEYPATALSGTAEFVGAGVFIALTLLLIDRRGFQRVLPRILIWSVTTSAALAIIGFFFHIDLFATQNAVYRKGIGGAIDHNGLTVLIIFVLPVLVHQILHVRRRAAQRLYAALLMVNLLAVVITYSRGGFIAMIGVLAMLAFVHRRRIRPRQIGILICVGLLMASAIAYTMPASFWQRQASLVAWEDRSLNRRTSYLTVAFDTILKNPVWGTGPDTFPNVYLDSETAKLHRTRGKVEARRAHNTYMEFLVGTGFAGFAIFITVLWLTFANFARAMMIARAAGLSANLLSLISSYRLALLGILGYLMIYSAMQHKFLLLSIALSQIALNIARKEMVADTPPG